MEKPKVDTDKTKKELERIREKKLKQVKNQSEIKK